MASLYALKTKTELIEVCKSRSIKGYSGKTKTDIINLLLSSELIVDDAANLSASANIKYIDLFCGIGGFHMAMQHVIPTSQCVFASDFDKNVQQTYEQNYGMKPHGDIKSIDVATIPKFDLICAGFPCQAFSIAQWKDRKAFDDPRGTLFFEILRIIDYHKPNCVLLENVANLIKIKNGVVLQTILNSLTTRGYKVSHALLSPHRFNVPQNRERIYIVATTCEQGFSFDGLLQRGSTCRLADILDTDIPEESYIDPSKYVILRDDQIKVQEKSGLKFCGYLKGQLRKVGARDNSEHLSRAHKQLMRIYSSDGTHPTLAASETTGRYHIYEESTKRVRRLTLNECYKLMAYPPSFVKHPKSSVAYKQIGNSVCVRVIEEILKELVIQGILQSSEEHTS